jgi:hypothetical protein
MFIVEELLGLICFIVLVLAPIFVLTAFALPLNWFARRRFQLHLSTAIVLMLSCGFAIPAIRWIVQSYIEVSNDWDNFPVFDEIVHLTMLGAVLATVLWIARLWEGRIVTGSQVSAVSDRSGG